MGYTHEEHMPEVTMSREEFFAFLNEVIMLRKKPVRECDKPSELNKKEKDIVYALFTTKTMEDACKLLKPLYEKYKCSEDSNGIKGKRIMPDLIIQSVYFIIMRECTLLMMDDKKITDGDKLRKKIKLDCTNNVFKILGEKSSKNQERMGIRPLRDFTMLNYEPVGFNSIQRRGAVFREILLSILFQIEYPMFIDLSGDMTIIEDFYYCDNEIVYCQDSNAAMFYHVIKYFYSDFCKMAKILINDLAGECSQVLKEYQEDLKRGKEKNEADYLADNAEVFKKFNMKKTILSYPLNAENDYICPAVKYLVITLLLNRKKTLEELKEDLNDILENEIKWLSMRFQNTYICWGKIKDILSVSSDGNMKIMQLDMKARQLKLIPEKGKKQWTFYENIEDTMKREMDEIATDCQCKFLDDDETKKILNKYKKNKDKRVKKGLVFFDNTVNDNYEDALNFVKFTESNDCKWIFVCNKKDIMFKKLLNSDNRKTYSEEKAQSSKNIVRKVIEINEMSECFYCFKYTWMVDKSIITNVDIRGLIYENIWEKADLAKTLYANNWEKLQESEIIQIKDIKEYE